MKPALFATLVLLTPLAAAAQGAPSVRQDDAPAVVKANAAVPPNAADLLFEQPQLKNVAPGTTLTYDYTRRSGIEGGPFGPVLDDRIKLMVDAGATVDARNVRVQMFSGANRFPAGPFEEMPGNPVMSLFLEHHLGGLARVLKANPRYIKNAIRKALREDAAVTPVQAPYKGRAVEAWRVETRPFAKDAMKDRMRGLSNITYVFVTSEAVPGEFLSIEARATDDSGGELLMETLSYDQNAG